MTEVPMPKLSMNMSEGVLVEWLVEDEEVVDEGQNIAEVESEKSTAAVDAPTSGTISIAVHAGEIVSVGTTLATIGETQTSTTEATEEDPRNEPTPESQLSRDQEDIEKETPPEIRATPSARRAARVNEISIEEVAESHGLTRVGRENVDAYVRKLGADTEQSPRSVESAAKDIDKATEPQEKSGSADPIAEESGQRVRASPAARQAAREHSIDLGWINGTGPDGAIIVADVETASQQPELSHGGEPPETTTDIDIHPPIRDRAELTGVRRTIADRLGESWRNAPHVTVNRDITVDQLQETKQTLNKQLDVDVSLNDLFLAALSKTLNTHPDFNATLEEGEHIRYDRIDIAIAVDTDRGLISPVLRDVDGKLFTEIASGRAELVTQTLADEVPPDQLTGGTFTVTNLGTMGVSSFTPIINPPQVAILGLSEVQEQATRTETGDVEFTNVMTASLSFDHRAVDGADAARFLETFDECLSNPLSVVVK